MNASTLLDGVLDSGRADAVALITDDGEVTYRELAGLVGATAARFRSLGVEREQRVLMVLDDSPAFHACFLGRDADRGGAGAGQPDGPGRQPRLLPRGQLRQGRRDRGCADAESREAMVAVRPDVHVLSWVGRSVVRGVRYMSRRRRSRGAGRHARRRHGVLALQLGVDGSAQGRRPLAPRYRGDDRELRAARPAGRPREDVCYSTTKLFHAYGLGNGLSFPMSVGAAAVLVRGRAAPGPDPGVSGSRRPTLFFSVPALYAAMARSPAAAGTDFSSVRACVSAAEPLPAAVLAALDGRGRRPDPRRDRVDRDAPHLLLEHARRPRSRHVRPPRPRLRAPGGRRGGP